MQDIKRERELRDSNANIRIYFEVRATALRPRLHTEGFLLCPYRTFHKGTSTEELQLQPGVNNSSLFLPYTRGRHKAQNKAKKRNTLGDHENHKQSLGDLKGLLAQRPITLVLMMINSCSYGTNDLVFNQFQICDQDLSRCVASTKDLKSSFGASTV